jgi:hypothetical protein
MQAVSRLSYEPAKQDQYLESMGKCYTVYNVGGWPVQAWGVVVPSWAKYLKWTVHLSDACRLMKTAFSSTSGIHLAILHFLVLVLPLFKFFMEQVHAQSSLRSIREVRRVLFTFDVWSFERVDSREELGGNVRLDYQTWLTSAQMIYKSTRTILQHVNIPMSSVRFAFVVIF